MKLKRVVQNAVRFVQDIRMLRANRRPGQQIVLVGCLPVRHMEWVTIVYHSSAGSAHLVRLCPNGRGVRREFHGYDISDSYTFPALTPCLSHDGFGQRRRLRLMRQCIRDSRMLWLNRESGERLTTVGHAHRNSRVERIRMIGPDRTTWKPQVKTLRDLHPSPKWHGGFIHRYVGETADNYSNGAEPCLVRESD